MILHETGKPFLPWALTLSDMRRNCERNKLSAAARNVKTGPYSAGQA